jgi:hypothetical protein
MLRIILREVPEGVGKSKPVLRNLQLLSEPFYYFQISKFTVRSPDLRSSLRNLPRILSQKPPAQPGAPQNQPTIYPDETLQGNSQPSLTICPQLSSFK